MAEKVERRPRVAVTLSDEAHDIVHRLAVIEGTSASRIIAGVIQDFLPVARQLVELGESVGQLDDSQKKKLEALAAAMEAGVMVKSSDALEAFSAALTEAREIVDGR